ncbi:MAG: glyoxylate/hydroxypyruvate reductase A [Alphaproteobacteria bacterium]
MAMMFTSIFDDPVEWQRYLTEYGANVELRVWPDVGPLEEIEFALVWRPKPGDLKRYPKLKVIFSMGAGVDHIFIDRELPKHVPVCRIIDEDLTAQMSEYAIYGVLHYHRKMASYAQAQKDHAWRKAGRGDTPMTRIGVMGVGQIGGDTARKLSALGFQVSGWSRTPKTIPGIDMFHGESGLEPFLAGSQFLVCVLPLTNATHGILNAKTLAMLPKGAFVINMARGAHVVDRDLIAALDSEHLAGAMLDVFEKEPLPPEHPFWAHAKIIVTPHIAGDLNPRTCAQQVTENIKRFRAGKPLLNVVDPTAEY